MIFREFHLHSGLCPSWWWKSLIISWWIKEEEEEKSVSEGGIADEMLLVLINFVATLFSPPNCSFDLSVTCSVTNVVRRGSLCLANTNQAMSIQWISQRLTIISAHHCSRVHFFFFFSWICRLSKRVLRPRRELWLLPSGTAIFTGPDPSRSPIRALLRPHGHPPRKYGPPPARTPPLQRSTALLRYHVPPSGGLPQPGAWHPGAPAQQHLLWGVWPKSTFYLIVAERQWIQQPPVPPPLGNERGHRVVAFWESGLYWQELHWWKVVSSGGVWAWEKGHGYRRG